MGGGCSSPVCSPGNGQEQTGSSGPVPVHLLKVGPGRVWPGTGTGVLQRGAPERDAIRTGRRFLGARPSVWRLSISRRRPVTPFMCAKPMVSPVTTEHAAIGVIANFRF